MRKISQILLWLAVFLGYLALGATIQTLPYYVIHHLGAGVTVAGWAVGIAFAATAFFRPITGWLADAGKTRSVVCIGGLLTALGGLGHLLATNVPELLVARIVMGAGEASLVSAAIPWVLASVPPQEKGKVAGWFGMSMWAGLVIGPVCASLISQVWSVTAVWFMVIVLGVLALVLVLPVNEPQLPSPVRSPFTLRGLLPPGAGLPGVVFGLSAYGYGTINTVLVLYLLHLHSSAEHYGLAVFGISYLLARLLGSSLVSKWGGKRLWFIFLLVEIVGLLLLSISLGGVPGAILGVIFVGVGISFMYPATVAVTLGRTGRRAPGTSVAVMTSFWDLGLLIAGPVSGYIAESTSYNAAFLIASIITCLAFILGILTSSSLHTRDDIVEANIIA